MDDSNSSLKYVSELSVVGKMQSFLHWITTNSTLLAILVTVGVAILLVCCMGCSNCPAREKDDLFRRHDV
jgi:heme/copper-type cytochrome/quinol oxidase subunit 2